MITLSHKPSFRQSQSPEIKSFSSQSHRTDPIPCLGKSLRNAAVSLFKFVMRRVHPLWTQLCYFLCLSLLGFLLLKMIPPKGSTATDAPSLLDVFFTSVSAATVSSMSTVEMEFFSNSQLVVLTILMFMGGEVFTSMLGLYMRGLKINEDDVRKKLIDPGPAVNTVPDQNELGLMVPSEILQNSFMSSDEQTLSLCRQIPSEQLTGRTTHTLEMDDLPVATDMAFKHRAVGYLGFVVLGYILVVNLLGSSMVLLYLSTTSSAGDVLRRKRIPMLTFSVFSVVSSFSNCGFIPTNENMVVFRQHSGLLLLIGFVILSGNTLYPPLLKLVIWILSRFIKKQGFEYILKSDRELKYGHLLPTKRCVYLVITVVGFAGVQFVLFCCMEWGSQGLNSLSAYRRLVGALFMSVNSRHAGECIVDISTASSAVLVLYVVMMYLPPYTTVMPLVHGRGDNSANDDVEGKTSKALVVRGLLVSSQLSYLAIFTVLICITERKKLTKDPLNFNVLNIVIEVVSAYGNVGFTVGYSCARQMKPGNDCSDMWYGFSGRWTDAGKLILICVMFFGRLKGFSMKAGRAGVLG